MSGKTTGCGAYSKHKKGGQVKKKRVKEKKKNRARRAGANFERDLSDSNTIQEGKGGVNGRS